MPSFPDHAFLFLSFSPWIASRQSHQLSLLIPFAFALILRSWKITASLGRHWEDCKTGPCAGLHQSPSDWKTVWVGNEEVLTTSLPWRGPPWVSLVSSQLRFSLRKATCDDSAPAQHPLFSGSEIQLWQASGCFWRVTAQINSCRTSGKGQRTRLGEWGLGYWSGSWWFLGGTLRSWLLPLRRKKRNIVGFGKNTKIYVKF